MIQFDERRDSLPSGADSMFIFPVCGPMNSPFSHLYCSSSTNWMRIRASRLGAHRLGRDRQSDDCRRRGRFPPVLLFVGVCGSASQLCSARHVRRLAQITQGVRLLGHEWRPGDSTARIALQGPFSSCAARYLWLFG